MLRRSFFDAALDLNGTNATDSKLSIQTGLQRRDVARLRKDDNPTVASPRHPLAEIISLWQADPQYATEALPLRGAAGFDSLARSVRKDVHPRTFLDELMAIGAVARDGDQLTLRHRTYRPSAGTDAQLDYLAANAGDHLSAAVRNVTEGADLPEAAVHFDGLSADAVRLLRAQWAEKSLALLHEIEALARALPQTDNGTCRFRAGIYFHDTTEEMKNDP